MVTYDKPGIHTSIPNVPAKCEGNGRGRCSPLISNGVYNGATNQPSSKLIGNRRHVSQFSIARRCNRSRFEIQKPERSWSICMTCCSLKFHGASAMRISTHKAGNTSTCPKDLRCGCADRCSAEMYLYWHLWQATLVVSDRINDYHSNYLGIS